MSHLNTMVGRCHVADSNTDVTRYIWSRFSRKGKRTFRSRPAAECREFWREVLAIHAQNQRVFFNLARGAKWITR